MLNPWPHTLCLAVALLSAPPVTGFARVPALPAEDVMSSTLAGEFAYQAGQTAEAAHWYLKAAQASTTLAVKAVLIEDIARQEG